MEDDVHRQLHCFVIVLVSTFCLLSLNSDTINVMAWYNVTINGMPHYPSMDYSGCMQGGFNCHSIPYKKNPFAKVMNSVVFEQSCCMNMHETSVREVLRGNQPFSGNPPPPLPRMKGRAGCRKWAHNHWDGKSSAYYLV